MDGKMDRAEYAAHEVARLSVGQLVRSSMDMDHHGPVPNIHMLS